MFKRAIYLQTILLILFSCGDYDPVNPHGFQETPPENQERTGDVAVEPENPLDKLSDTITRDQAVGFLSVLNQNRSSNVDCLGTNAPAVGALSWDNSLYVAAYRHNQDMTVNNFVSDIGSDQSWIEDRVPEVGNYFIVEQVVSNNQVNTQPDSDFSDLVSSWKLERKNCFIMMGKAWNTVAVSRSATHTTVVFGSVKP